MRSKDQKRFDRIAHITMTCVTLSAVLPILLVFLSSITEENTLIRNGYSFFPKRFSLYAYQYILVKGDKIFRAYGITIFVTVAGTAVNILMSSMLAYALSVEKLPGHRFLVIFVLLTLLFNGGLVPTYLMYTNFFHIKNTLAALIVPKLLMHTMNVFLMKSNYSQTIPGELYEAAEMDGASQFHIFWRIVLPLGKPINVTMAVFSGLTYWNDWTNGLYYLTGYEGEKLYSIQNFLNKVMTDIQYLNSAQILDSGLSEKLPVTSVRMAIAFVAMLPVMCMLPFLQKYFAKGLSAGAVKG